MLTQVLTLSIHRTSIDWTTSSCSAVTVRLGGRQFLQDRCRQLEDYCELATEISIVLFESFCACVYLKWTFSLPMFRISSPGRRSGLYRTRTLHQWRLCHFCNQVSNFPVNVTVNAHLRTVLRWCMLLSRRRGWASVTTRQSVWRRPLPGPISGASPPRRRLAAHPYPGTARSSPWRLETWSSSWPGP